MSDSGKNRFLQDTILDLFQIVNSLEIAYKDYDRRFTVDGHLLGSIGEIWAAEHYGIKLFPNSTELYDGVAPNGVKVQIKITQKNRVSFYGTPDFVLVFGVGKDGEVTEIYNGPTKDIFDGRVPAKNGQISLTVGLLKKQMTKVSEAEKIPLLN